MPELDVLTSRRFARESEREKEEKVIHAGKQCHGSHLGSQELKCFVNLTVHQEKRFGVKSNLVLGESCKS